MKEANFILQHATKNSLIIMDELGNGKFRLNTGLLILNKVFIANNNNSDLKLILYFYGVIIETMLNKFLNSTLVLLHPL